MQDIDADPLPDAYLRLIAAQRRVTPQEQQEIEVEQTRESLANRIRRRLPKVY